MIKNVLTSLRLSLSMVFLLCAVEAMTMYAAGQEFLFSDLLKALIITAACALLLSIVIGICVSYIKRWERNLARVTIMTVTLGTVFALFLDVFVKVKLWAILLTAAALVILLVTLARLVWIYARVGGEYLKEARFTSLAPTAMLCLGMFAALEQALDMGRFMVTLVSSLLVLFVLLQYLAIRFVWARRRESFGRWSLRAHYAVIVLVPALAAAGWFIEKERIFGSADSDASGPPVVLITIDTLRYDGLSVNDPDNGPTPNLDALAADGVNFKNAITPSSWTPPSMASILSGLYPGALGSELLVLRVGMDHKGIPEKAVTIGEAFKNAGYGTAAIVRNAWLSENRGFTQGFDYYEILEDWHSRPHFIATNGMTAVLELLGNGEKGLAERLTNGALELLDQAPEAPFFLWLHYIDPHLPYDDYKAFPVDMEGSTKAVNIAIDSYAWRAKTKMFGLTDEDKEFIRQRYYAGVRYTDREVGRVIDRLKGMGLYQEAVILVTSDHGEELWDHGGFEHGHTFHNEVLHVPFIIKLPGLKHAGREVDEWVSVKNTGATLVEASGLDETFPGTSLLPCINGECPGDPIFGDMLFSEGKLYGYQRGTLGNSEGKKALFLDDSVQCYDLDKDPDETNPLASEQCDALFEKGRPEDILDFIKKENEELKKTLDLAGSGHEPADKKELERLRALGYIK